MTLYIEHVQKLVSVKEIRRELLFVFSNFVYLGKAINELRNQGSSIAASIKLVVNLHSLNNVKGQKDFCR